MATAPDPDEVLRSTRGKEHFQRIARLLISGGTTLLREIFDQLCPPSSLPTILKNTATEKQLKAAKLTKPQWDCLYPSPGVYGKSTDFDVTLLFRLLRTICNLIPPIMGWDALPTSTDHSLAADLVRIKYYRNSVYGHVNQQMEVTDDFDFLSLWREISEALVRIAGHVNPAKKHEWHEAIDKLLRDPLTTEDERNVQELQEWYRNDMDVKKSIEELTVTTVLTNEKLAEVKTALKGIYGLLEEKTQGVNALYKCSEVQELITRLGCTSGSSQSATALLPGQLSSTGLSVQIGPSEVMGLKEIEDVTVGVSGISFESEGRGNEILLKYEQAKTLQAELGYQMRRLLDIEKHFAATCKLATKQSEYQLKHNSALLVGSGVQLAGTITQLFTIAVGLPFFLVGVVIFVVESLRHMCSANEVEPQLLTEFLQTAGQLKEAAHVYHSKLCSFIQCLECIVKFCQKYPNELVVLRECGQVSTQDILRDINIFRSRLDDFIKSVINSEEIHNEMILDKEEAMSSNREAAGGLEDVSALSEDEKMMKLIALTEAPIIVTTRMTVQ